MHAADHRPRRRQSHHYRLVRLPSEGGWRPRAHRNPFQRNGGRHSRKNRRAVRSHAKEIIYVARWRGQINTNTDPITKHAIITANPPVNDPVFWLISPNTLGPKK